MRGRSDAAAPRKARRRAALLAVLGVVALLGSLLQVMAQQPPASSQVPPAEGTNAVITVRVGGDRSGVSSVAGLAGVTLQLYNGGSSGSSTPVGAGWATCVSDSDGDCSFVVPDTGPGGANRDERFWVVQTGTPTGWFANPTLRVGSGSGASADYEFRTGERLRAGATYTSQRDFMLSTSNTNNSASGGIWQVSRANPVLAAQCGLNVALVLDVSGSVANALPQLKQAAQTFTNSLVGTPSQLGLFTFSQNAPANATNNRNRPLTPVSTQAGADTVNGWIAGLTAGGTTNWDRGLAQVAASGSPYDVAIIITDGNPTVYGNPAEGPGSRTRFREVENGIFSANLVKAQGTRVIAFGVGAGVSGAPDNLASISGRQRGSDYFQTADFTQAGTVLRDLALGACEGSVSVIKLVVPSSAPEGSIDGATPAGGWQFDASVSGGATIAPTSGATGDGTGGLNFDLDFPGGTTTAAVTLSETLKPGFTLVPRDGANAECQRLDTNAPVQVSNVGGTGFVVDADVAYPVSCTVYNRAPDVSASVVVDKVWEINGDPYPDGQQPLGLIASLLLDATPQPWGVERTGLEQGGQLLLDETLTVALRQCSVVSQEVTDANGEPASGALPFSYSLVAGVNTFTVTNTLDCETKLSLTKNVRGGDADPRDWVLSARGPDGALPGPVGGTGTTAEVTPTASGAPVTYVLSEDRGDPRYVQVADPNASPIPGSTVSWNCVEVGEDLGDIIPGFADGLNGGVQVPFGAWVRCEALNETADLALVKEVENNNGGTLGPEGWELTATPTGPDVPAGLAPETVTGSGFFLVRPGQPYALSESGPDGYTPSDWECEDFNTGEAVPSDGLTLGVGQQVVCTITNDDEPASLTLVKEVVNDSGGSAAPADWTLAAEGPTPVSGVSGSPEVTDAEVDAGTYTLSENGPGGYAPSDWTCVGGSQDGAAVTLALGESATCTIENDDLPGTLTLTKVVDAGTSGSGALPSDWTVTATPVGIAGQGPVSGNGDPADSGGVNQVSVFAGSYELSESGPDGFAEGVWTCQGGQVTDGTVEVPNGGDVSCQITNTAVPPTLTLVKAVDNGTTGGTAVETDWTLTANGPVDISGATGDEEVTGAVVEVGTYSLSEAGPDGYAPSAWVCTGASAATDGSVTLDVGDAATCSITNTAIPATLTLVKEVINDSGGAAEPTEWALGAEGPTPISGVTGSVDVTDAEVAVGTYDLSETGGPPGYEAGAWACVGGTPAPGSVALALGESATCTVVNDDQPATARVVKSTTPEGLEAGWTMTLSGPGTPTGGLTSVTGTDGTASFTDADGPFALRAGDYTVTETVKDGWRQVSSEGCEFSVDLPDDLGRVFTCELSNQRLGSLVVTKDVVWGSVTPDPGQEFEVCVEGPSYPDTPDCQTVGSAGGDLSWSDLVPGEYVVSETDAGPLWATSIDNAAPVVPADGSQAGPVTVTNTRLSGGLTVTKTVDWNGTTPDPAQAFEVCVTGAGAVDPQCQELDEGNGFTASWPTLDPGEYTVAETDPGPSWTVAPASREVVVTVEDGQAATAAFTNTAVVPTWELTKTSDPESGSTVQPGDTIRYTLTAEHESGGPVVGATAEDDLSDVLPYATLSEPLPADLSLSGTTLVWAMPEIPVGGSASVSFEVTVKADAADVTVLNVASPSSPGGHCSPCQTQHPVPPTQQPPDLPATGTDTRHQALMALLLILTGLVFVGLTSSAIRDS